jgi:hypothetical protein
MAARCLLTVSLALGASAARRGAKSAAVADPNCVVTSTSVDGTEEQRDCFLVSDSDMKPGTKGRFESCTQ